MGALDVIIVRGKKKKRVVRAGTIIKIVMFMNDELLDSVFKWSILIVLGQVKLMSSNFKSWVQSLSLFYRGGS